MESIQDLDDITSGLSEIQLYDWKNYREPQTLHHDYLSDQVEDIDSVVILEHITDLLDNHRRNNKITLGCRVESKSEYVAETCRFAHNGKTKTSSAKGPLIRAILDRIMENLKNPIDGKVVLITPRQMYYLIANSSEKVGITQVTDIIDDLCCLWRCTRKSIAIGHPSTFSSFAGCVAFVETDVKGNEVITDCANMAKPYVIDMTSIVAIKASPSRPASFILVVEKDTIFDRLVRIDQFCQKYPCVLVTGRGQPDLQCRLFLRQLYHTLKIPVLMLADFNVYGIEIMKSYKVGSYSMSFQSFHLVTPSIKFLGLSGNDLIHFHINHGALTDMTEEEFRKTKRVSEQEWVKADEDIKSSLALQLNWRKRADIEVLEVLRGYSFLSSEYLPYKLQGFGFKPHQVVDT